MVGLYGVLLALYVVAIFLVIYLIINFFVAFFNTAKNITIIRKILEREYGELEEENPDKK